MPLIQLPDIEIRIQIPVLKIDDTEIYRDAYCSEMKYDLNGKQVVLNWTVQHFSIKDNEKGEYLPSISDYVKISTANNQTMCDITTGVPVYPDTEGNYPEEINYTPQYDFFNYAAASQELRVQDMIKSFGAAIENWERY